jgi:capsular polysaccharide biosynthesis protein
VTRGGHLAGIPGSAAEREITAGARSWIWLLIASLLLAGGAAYLVSSALPKVYEAKVTLLVGQSSSSSTPNYNDLLASQRISQTYADLATTGTILSQVISNAGLRLTTD